MQREKKCAVIGLARAGIPAAKFLAKRGAQVVGYDAKTREQLGEEAAEMEKLGIELRLGSGDFPGLKECALIILSPGLKVHHDPLFTLLAECAAEGAEIIGELELAARHCPAPMIAVTGTKGKSTTTKLIAEMLGAAGIDAVRAGNTGIPLIAELPNISPQSWTVIEVSSFQLEFAPTLKPRIAALLNLLPDHQDYHTSLEQYWSTKLKLFSHQNVADIAIFNADDDNTSRWRSGDLRLQPAAGSLQAKTLFTTGKELDGAGPALAAGRCDGALGFVEDGSFFPVVALDDIPLQGAHNVGNVAIALVAVRAVLDGQGIDFAAVREKIAACIRAFESLPHRLERVAEVQGVTYINDSQATIPDAAIRALESFKAPVTLIAGGMNKLENSDAFDELGRAVALKAHRLVTIGKAAPLIEEAALRAGYSPEKIVAAGDIATAVQAAAAATPAGGTVVMSPACASFDQFKSFEDRGEQYRAAVAALG